MEFSAADALGAIAQGFSALGNDWGIVLREQKARLMHALDRTLRAKESGSCTW